MGSGLVVLFEGSGRLDFTWEETRWPDRQHRRSGPFEMTADRQAYADAHADRPWAARIRTPAFWQCRLCGWSPLPQPVKCRGKVIGYDDSIWPWFSALDQKQREMLVRLSAEIWKTSKEISRGKRPPVGDKYIERW